MRYKLIISYNGKNYSGFQKQINKKTVQETIEKVLTEVLRKEITIVASGRTDGGVSAFSQVCHFDSDEAIDVKRTIGYSNRLLPNDIRIFDIEEVSMDFHARYSAKEKTYEYYFYTGNISPIYEEFATFLGGNINITAMKEACKCFIGEYDFTSFCAANTDVKSKVRRILNAEIINVNENLYKLSITGNGFLYNMVRIIMGTIASVGFNKIKTKDIKDIILAKDRSLAGKTMPSKGLYLKKVIY